MRIPLLFGGLCLSLGMSQAESLPPKDPDQPSAPRAEAQLLISRDRDLPKACAVELLLEQQQPARLPAGESLELQVPPGEFSVRVQLTPAADCAKYAVASSRSILIGPGETQRYRVMLGDQGLFLAPELD